MKATLTPLLYIPVDLELPNACKLTLLNGRPVSQFSGGHIDDFSGRGGVVIYGAGIDALQMSIQVVSR